MLHELLGVLMIGGVCALVVQYRPRADENRMLCAMAAVMGLVTLIAGQGNALFSAVQAALDIAVGVCCALRLRREYLCRRRRQRRMRALRRAPVCHVPLRRAG